MPPYDFRRLSDAIDLIESRDFPGLWQARTYARALSREAGGQAVAVCQGDQVIETVVALPGEIR